MTKDGRLCPYCGGLKENRIYPMRNLSEELPVSEVDALCQTVKALSRKLGEADTTIDRLTNELAEVKAQRDALREGWISVDERFPPMLTPFLAWTLIHINGEPTRGVAALVADEGGTLYYADAGNDEEYGWRMADEPFTHWRPLPEPPSETL